MNPSRVLIVIAAGCGLITLPGCGSDGVPFAPGPLAGMSYQAFGDSITYGFSLSSPKTQAYPYLVGEATGMSVSDYAISGDQACDILPRQIAKTNVGYTDAATASMLSILIGTNDVDVKGLGSYEAVFETCHQAVIAWLAVRQADKLLAGDPRLTATGVCADVASAEYFEGIFCAPNASGTITTEDLKTSGSPIYVWYVIADASSQDASFTLTIDDKAMGAFSTRPLVPITTQNGTTQSVAIARIPVAAGAHSVSISTATGGIAILGIGSSAQEGGRTIVVGDLPEQLLSSPRSPVSSQIQYSADIQADIAIFASDGLDVRFAPDRAFMFGTSPEMNDSVHPSALGQQHMASAFENTFLAR